MLPCTCESCHRVSLRPLSWKPWHERLNAKGVTLFSLLSSAVFLSLRYLLNG